MAYRVRLGDPARNEENAIQDLANVLGNEWALLTNLPQRTIGVEIDACIVGPRGILVLELKNHKGKIAAKEYGSWEGIVGNDKDKSPFDQATVAAQRLKSYLGDQQEQLKRGIYVDWVVVMTHPQCELVLESPALSDRVSLLRDVKSLVERRLNRLTTERSWASGLRLDTLQALFAALRKPFPDELLQVWGPRIEPASPATPSPNPYRYTPPADEAKSNLIHHEFRGSGASVSPTPPITTSELGFAPWERGEQIAADPDASPSNKGLSPGKVLAGVAAALFALFVAFKALPPILTSNIEFTDAAIAHGIENGRPVGQTAKFEGSSASVSLIAYFKNASRFGDQVSIGIQGYTPCEISIQIAEGYVSCTRQVSEGWHAFDLTVNGKFRNSYSFRVLDPARVKRMIQGVRMSEQVRTTRPAVDTRRFVVGSTAGIYIEYAESLGDTMSLKFLRNGVPSGECKDYQLASQPGAYSYYCDWRLDNAGSYTVIAYIDGIRVGRYKYTAVAQPAPPPPSELTANQTGRTASPTSANASTAPANDTASSSGINSPTYPVERTQNSSRAASNRYREQERRYRAQQEYEQRHARGLALQERLREMRNAKRNSWHASPWRRH